MTDAARVLVVGVGGLGSPMLRVLATRPGIRLTLVDDDVVEESNLHRQTLYGPSDVGRPKTERAAEAVRSIAPEAEVEVVEGRFVPATALELLREHSIVVEGADNLATKFLVADASRLAGVTAIHAGAVRWAGWAFCALPEAACLRCVFEDIPRDRVETCAEAGVLGPVVGVLGALQAAFVLRLLEGEQPAGELWHYDALRGALRKTSVLRRGDCALCNHEIRDLRMERYTAACAA